MNQQLGNPHALVFPIHLFASHKQSSRITIRPSNPTQVHTPRPELQRGATAQGPTGRGHCATQHTLTKLPPRTPVQTLLYPSLAQPTALPAWTPWPPLLGLCCHPAPRSSLEPRPSSALARPSDAAPSHSAPGTPTSMPLPEHSGLPQTPARDLSLEHSRVWLLPEAFLPDPKYTARSQSLTLSP